MRIKGKSLVWIEVGVIAASLLFTLPLILLVLTSFKPESEILNFQSILPKEWSLQNYARLFSNPETIPISSWLVNSILVSGFTTLFVTASASLGAFALARLQLPGKRPLFLLIIGTMLLPGEVLLVPVYLILNALGWIDTPRALVLPAIAGAFGIFLLYQFFQTIPRDLEDAASIDGCSAWGQFIHVGLPHARSSIAALAIITFIGSWNDFLGPLVFLDSIQKYTLPVGLALFQSSYATSYGLLFAASVLSTAPLVAVFLFFQKYIIQGISFTGMKD